MESGYTGLGTCAAQSTIGERHMSVFGMLRHMALINLANEKHDNHQLTDISELVNAWFSSVVPGSP